MTEGHVTMEITKIESDDEQMAAQMQMLKGTQTDTYFTQEQYKSVMSIMGGMMNVTNVVNNESGKMDMYMDMMGQKMWIDTNMEEAGKDKPSTEDVKITYDKANTKEILGYNCYMMTISSPEMEGGTVQAYITQDIKSDAKFIQGYEKVKFEGFPLEVTLKMPQMTMTMETTKLEKTVPADAFTISTEGYQKMTMSQFTEKMGGMGAGGFGF